MPEIDPNLYQILTLVLLAVIALALIGVVSALSGIKKSLSEGGGKVPAEPQAQPAPAEERPTPVEQPQPAAAVATSSPTPSEAAVPSGGFVPTEQEPPRAAAEPAPAEVAAAPEPAAAAPEPAAEPQEQPFERDGRWWFRRGNELLVYDETSGQWVPAPSAAPVGGAAAAGAAEPAASEGGFWKCPSCGAVNGSTATTCRMCFTARP